MMFGSGSATKVEFVDHKAFRLSLSTAQKIALVELNDSTGLRHLAGHWSAIGLFTVLIIWAVPFWPVIMVVQGVSVVFLFTLLHETCHKTPFKSGWINDVVGHVCGFILFLPATWFRFFHLAHHRYTQIPDKDPELAEAKPETWVEYVRYISGIPVWISHMKTLIRNAAGRHDDAFVPQKRRDNITTEARRYLIGYAVLLGLSLWMNTLVLVYIWLLPMLFGQPFLRLYLLAEHGRCPFVANMFENTRTTFTNRFVRTIAWNMPYHTEHHSYPTVPFHKLPELHKLIKPHLLITAKGYASFSAEYARDFDK